jgi:hypothetical protein
MSETVNFTFKVQAVGGPGITAAQNLVLETYSKSSLTVLPTTSEDVSIIAGPSVLIVSSDSYSAGGQTVTYKINGGADKKLDGPLVLVGTENVKLLNAAVNKLTFNNTLATDIHINVLSGNPA